MRRCTLVACVAGCALAAPMLAGASPVEVGIRISGATGTTGSQTPWGVSVGVSYRF